MSKELEEQLRQEQGLICLHGVEAADTLKRYREALEVIQIMCDPNAAKVARAALQEQSQ